MSSDVVTVAVVISLTSVAILGSFLILRFCIRQLRKGKEWNRNYLQFLQNFFGGRPKRVGKFASKHPQFWEGLGYRHPSQQSLQTHSSLDSSFASSKTSSTSCNDIYSKIDDDKKNRKSSYIRRSIRKLRQTIRNRRRIRLATHHRAYSHDHIYVSKNQTSSSGKTSSAENSQTYIKNTKFKKKSEINTLGKKEWQSGSLNEVPLITNNDRSNSIISLNSVTSEPIYRSGSSLKDGLSLSVSSLQSAISDPIYYRRSTDINNIEIGNHMIKSGRSVSSDHIYSQISKKGSRSSSSLIIPQSRPHSFPNESFIVPQFDLNRTQSLSILPDSSQNTYSIQNSDSGIERNFFVKRIREKSPKLNEFNYPSFINTSNNLNTKYIQDERLFSGSQISLERAIQSNLPRTRNPLYIQRMQNGCDDQYRMEISNNQNGLEPVKNIELDHLNSNRKIIPQVSLSNCKIFSESAVHQDDIIIYEKVNPTYPLLRNLSQSHRNLEEPMPIPDSGIADKKITLDNNCKFTIITTAEIHDTPLIEAENPFQIVSSNNSSTECIHSHLENNIKRIFPDQPYETNEQLITPKEEGSHYRNKSDMNWSNHTHTPWKHRYLNHSNKILPDKFRPTDTQISNKLNEQSRIKNYNENAATKNKHFNSTSNPNPYNRKFHSSSAIDLQSRNATSKYEYNPGLLIKSSSDVIPSMTYLTEKVPSPCFNKRYFGVKNYSCQYSSANMKNKGKCQHEKHLNKTRSEFNFQNRLLTDHTYSHLKNKPSVNNKLDQITSGNVNSSNDLFYNSNNYTTTCLPNNNEYKVEQQERISIIDIFGNRLNNNKLMKKDSPIDNQVENSENELNHIRNNVTQQWDLEENNDIYSSIPYRESITSIQSEDLEMIYNQKTMNNVDEEFYNLNTDKSLEEEIYFSIGSQGNGFHTSHLETNEINEEVKAEVYSWLDYSKVSSPKDLYTLYAPLSYEKNWFLRTLSFRKAIEGSLRHKPLRDIEAQFSNADRPNKETLI